MSDYYPGFFRGSSCGSRDGSRSGSDHTFTGGTDGAYNGANFNPTTTRCAEGICSGQR